MEGIHTNPHPGPANQKKRSVLAEKSTVSGVERSSKIENVESPYHFSVVRGPVARVILHFAVF